MKGTSWRVGGGGWCGEAREPRAKKVVRVRGAKAERTNCVRGSSSRWLFCLSLSLSESSGSFVSCAWAKPFQFSVGPPLSLALSLAASSLSNDFSGETPLILYVRRYACRSEESARARINFVGDFVRRWRNPLLVQLPSQLSHKQLKTAGTTERT